jgi:hypothetical protein
MPIDEKYSMKPVKSTGVIKTEKRPRRVAMVKKPSTQEIFRAFKKARGYGDIVAQIPKAATLAGWGDQIAYFSVCRKSGTARWLDIWDCDHFDGFTDMRRCVSDCRAWFSHRGYSTWGSAETATGRINCYFNAPAAGNYSCVAQLASYPSSSGATVDCLIDNQSFGNLPFTGTISQSHFCPSLSAGGHHFRIRQVSGSFFFLSLTVLRF